MVGDDVVQLAGDAGTLLQEPAVGAFGLADGLLLGQPALCLGPFAEGTAEQQHHSGQHHEHHAGARRVAGPQQAEQYGGGQGRQPDRHQSAAGQVEGKRQAEQQIADDRRDGPRPRRAAERVGPEHKRQGGQDVGAEDHVPDRQRPDRGQQQGRGLADAQQAGETAGKTVVAEQDHDGRRQQRGRRREGEEVRQQPHPWLRCPGEQRLAGLRRAERPGQQCALPPGPGQQPAGARFGTGEHDA